MKKLNILFTDWGLSKDKIESVLLTELNLDLLSLAKSLRKQLRNNDGLSNEMMTQLESGEMLSTEIIGNFIKRNLNEIDGNILLTEYPRTFEQYNKLEKVLSEENIKLDKVWYFKQRKPDEYMKRHFENPKVKQWIDKFDDEIIEKWKKEFNRRREEIAEIQAKFGFDEWKTIEVDYVSELDVEYIKQLIKDHA